MRTRALSVAVLYSVCSVYSVAYSQSPQFAAGKQADLVVLDGDPSRTMADARKVDTVFKQGIGFDPAKLTASVTGKVGLW